MLKFLFLLLSIIQCLILKTPAIEQCFDHASLNYHFNTEMTLVKKYKDCDI